MKTHLLLVASLAAAHAAEAPRTFALSGPALLAARSDASLAQPLAQLRAEADALLSRRPASVLDKSKVSTSGDKHDYYSFGPYWWPDPRQPNGLPYVLHDGKVNPESKRGTDDAALYRTCAAVETLGLAYWFTADEKYAEKADTLMRVWFLDPRTRMNPNLEHAQAIPGKNDGRGIGIIEGRHFIELNDGIALLAGSRAWSPADQAAWHAWLSDYFHWLTTSPHARDEANEKNNHGSWKDAQTVDIALALGRNDVAKQILAAVPRKRIATQIEPDGSQPLELRRTRSLNYVLFNLEALSDLASFGQQVGVDLRGFSTPDGRSLAAALAVVAPFADPKRPWPKEDLDAADRERILPLLAAAERYRDRPEFREALARFGHHPQPGEHWRLAAGPLP